MKTKKYITALLAAVLFAAGAWAEDTDCPCPGDTDYSVDCNGNGENDACETSDCPVVDSITADLSGKTVGDTLSLSDFTITTTPSDASVTLSGDLTVANGSGTVTAKASEHDTGKTFSYIGATKYIDVSYDESTKQIIVKGKILGHDGTLRVLVEGSEIASLSLDDGVEESKPVDPDTFDSSSGSCTQTETEGDVEVSQAGAGVVIVAVGTSIVATLLTDKCPTLVENAPSNNWTYEETENSDYDPQRVGAYFSPQLGGHGLKIAGGLLWATSPKVGLQVTALVSTKYTDPDDSSTRTVDPRNKVKWKFHGEDGSDVENDGRMAGAQKQFTGKVFSNITGGRLEGSVASMEPNDLWGNLLTGALWDADISF